MKVLISSVFVPKDKIFGFVLHKDDELPVMPMVKLAQVDRSQIEWLRNQLNEVLEW